MELTIDKEFESLCRELQPEELNFLDESLERDGCLAPIIVWANHEDTILDGHNRYRICKRNGYKFTTKAIVLADRDAAREWIIKHQLGKRNLTDEERSYYRGLLYQQHKKSHGGDRKSSGQNVHLIDGQMGTIARNALADGRTAKKIAAENNTDEKTIRRDAKFASAVDKIETVRPSTKREILSGKSALSKKDVVEIAELEPEEIPAAIEKRKTESPRSVTLSGSERLIEGIEKLIEKVNSLAATHGMGHNAQSRALVAHLKDAVKLTKAMAKSWRNE